MLVEVPLVPVEAAQVVVEGARPKSVERVAPNLAADSSAINAVREALEEEVALEEKVVALEEEMALEVVVVPEAEMLPMAVVEAEEDLLG